MSDKSFLLSIIAYARGGAVDYAWRLLRERGFDQMKDDPAVLCIVGRLLKDRARGTTGKARQALCREAAASYARAHELNGATYPLINAATLSLLAGDDEHARVLATRVLEIGQQVEEAETPYYRAATQAEAHLLLGDVAQAQSCLTHAMARAPRAYEDHASTLRQFGLIIELQGGDGAWLDSLRPPRCLHFAGHMGLASDDEELRGQIEAWLKEERIGFGFGALAAGADILIAEALLKSGAELHVLLPAAPERFREISVLPFGSDWAVRFDRALAQASSVRVVEGGASPLSPHSLQLTTEVAMGRAVMQASVLETEPVQLVILDHDPSSGGVPGSSQWAYAMWGASRRRQRALVVPRIAGKCGDDRWHGEAPEECLATILRIAWENADNDARVGSIVRRLANVLARVPAGPDLPCWTGDAVFAVFEKPRTAAKVALMAIAALADIVDLNVSAHYGVVQRTRNPFGDGTPLFTGTVAALPARIITSTPPGAVYVTEDLAAALYTGPELDRPSAGYVGDLPDAAVENPVRLFGLYAPA